MTHFPGPMTGLGIKLPSNDATVSIYPAYYEVCMGMLLLFTFVPETSAKFLPSLRMPRTTESWRYSLLLMTAPDGNELLHGSMALRVELWF